MHPISDIGVDSFRADLHCHTSCSDGSLDPKEIIDLAIAMGLSALAITDHDTIDAYKMAVPHAQKKNFFLGTGVEFSCEFSGVSLHILGYDFSLENEEFIAYCARQQQKRLMRNREILKKLSQIQIFVQEEELLEIHHKASTLGRPHIAAMMVRKGYVKSIQEAFHFYIGDGRRCFVPGDPFPVVEAIRVIHEAGGKAFLAHPHLYSNSHVVKEVLQLPFNGIECFYGRSPHYYAKRWQKMAKQKNLLMSGGSDFHGDAKPHISLGSSWVNKEIFHSIFEKNLIV